MRIGEVAEQAQVSIKAVRYYEQLGLVRSRRRPNGYRDYSAHALRVIAEIRALAAVGINPARAAPFIACLDAGHRHGDDCPSSLAAYRDGLAELDHTIAALTARRTALAARLQAGAARTTPPTTTPEEPRVVEEIPSLPEHLPVPVDDGAAAHLPGLPVPAISLRSTAGAEVNLADLGAERSIIYVYPLTGVPGTDLPEGWDAIPGARGCTTEACDFRDHHALLHEAGVAHVFGVSSQDRDYQREVVERLRLPFPMLSDPTFALSEALALPTFAAPGHARLYTRLTLVVKNSSIEHVFYPIFPPNTHAQQVLAWLHA